MFFKVLVAVSLVLSFNIDSTAQKFEFQTLDINNQGYANLDFVGMPPKKGYKEVLVIENTGQEDLTIFSVESGCHCIKARVQKKKLKPKQSTKLFINWSPAPDVEFSSSISIFTNDTNFKEVWLRILGNIK